MDVVGPAQEKKMLVHRIDMAKCESSVAFTPGYIHLFNQIMQEDRMMPELFPLLIHCIGLKEGKFVFRQEKLEGLYKSWKQSVNSQLIPPVSKRGMHS